MSTPDLDAHTPCQCEACQIIYAQDTKDDDLNAWADYNRKPQHELDRLRAALLALRDEMRVVNSDKWANELTAILENRAKH